MIQYSLNKNTKLITVLQKLNYLHLANLLNYKFHNFTELETYTLVNENNTFSIKVYVHSKYLQRYLSDTIEYIT